MKSFLSKLLYQMTATFALQSMIAGGCLSYEVKPGDTLSTIIFLHLPKVRIYGKRGMLLRVARLNPHLSNMDQLSVNQVILLPNESNEEATVNENAPFHESTLESVPAVMVDADPPDSMRAVSSVKEKDEWRLSFLYGARFVSLHQRGSLGAVDLGVVFLNDFSFLSEYEHGDFKVRAFADTYDFKYSNSAFSQSGDKRLTSFGFGASYASVQVNLRSEAHPLFRNSTGSVELVAENIYLIDLGYEKEVSISSAKTTVLRLKALVSYALGGSSDDLSVKLDSFKGFGLSGAVELERNLFHGEASDLSLVWNTDASWQKTSRQVNWTSSIGQTDLEAINIRTAIGLRFGF